MNFHARVISRLLVLMMLSLLLASCASHSRSVPLQNSMHAEFGSDADPEQQVKNLSIEELLARGEKYAAQGNYELSIFHYKQALGRDAESVPALMGLGGLFWKQGSFEAAEKVYQRTLEIDEQYVPALIGSGKALRKLGKLEESENRLQQAIDEEPDNLEVMTELAITYDHAGNYDLSEPIFRQVTERSPGKPGALNNLGFNLLLQQRYGEAIQPLQEALKLNPRAENTKNNLATAYLMTGKTTRARSLFEDTIGIAGAWNNIGYIHLKRGEWDMAEQAFEKALDLNPKYYARAKKNLMRTQELREAEKESH